MRMRVLPTFRLGTAHSCGGEFDGGCIVSLDDGNDASDRGEQHASGLADKADENVGSSFIAPRSRAAEDQRSIVRVLQFCESIRETSYALS